MYQCFTSILKKKINVSHNPNVVDFKLIIIVNFELYMALVDHLDSRVLVGTLVDLIYFYKWFIV